MRLFLCSQHSIGLCSRFLSILNAIFALVFLVVMSGLLYHFLRYLKTATVIKILLQVGGSSNLPGEVCTHPLTALHSPSDSPLPLHLILRKLVCQTCRLSRIARLRSIPCFKSVYFLFFLLNFLAGNHFSRFPETLRGILTLM